jgi:predicted nucleic acid-binding protein
VTTVRVLVDTSVWVAHFRTSRPALQALLESDAVVQHPWVTLELACGTPPAPRAQTLKTLALLRPAVVATLDEVMALIETNGLAGQGCGAVDLALLASARLTPEAKVWTLDARLAVLAQRLGVAWSAPIH